MPKEQTIKDFHKAVETTKKYYEVSKMNYQMNYTTDSQSTTGYDEIMFINQMKATKILYNHEMKMLLVSEIFVNDAKRMLEKLEEING